MSYKKTILRILREEEDESIKVTSTSDNLQDTISTVKDATNQDSSLKGKVEVDVTTEGEELEEGMDNLEVPDDAEAYEDEYEEKEKLKQLAAKEMANEVVGRMTKGKLEKLVEQNKKIGAAYKKIIKVSELRSKKNG